MRFYNTYTKQIEPFTVENNIVRMYNCGPTVYNYVHIGNFRSFLLADILRRYLEFKGYEVQQVMNFTDVGHMTQDDLLPEAEKAQNVDKMALAAQRTGITDPNELADFYIEKFMEDSKLLRCKEPLHRPKASEHITEMQEIIEKLIANGHAYEVDGFVYFEESSFAQYGQLSGNTPEDLVAGHRVEIDSRKRKPTDFALWKCDDKHIMKWESPWGVGFPGWHIECSAMAMKYLGDTLDIHTGGEDNIFPHHEAEIAQSEGATGHKFCRYWIHARHLLVDDSKMSKSKGNFFTVRDLTEMGYRGEEIRYALISSHYRQKMNFETGVDISCEDDEKAIQQKYSQIEKIEALEKSRTAIRRIDNFIHSMQQVESGGKHSKVFTEAVAALRNNFEEAMDDDLNISEALAAIFQFVREVNKMRDEKRLSQKNAQTAIAEIQRLDQVLDILPVKEEGVPQEVLTLVERRNQARSQKNYAEADKIRDQIHSLGYAVEDTPNGVMCKKL